MFNTQRPSYSSITKINNNWYFNFIDPTTRELNKYLYLSGEKFVEETNISNNWIKVIGNKKIDTFKIKF
jgi:hypothetical protein